MKWWLIWYCVGIFAGVISGQLWDDKKKLESILFIAAYSALIIIVMTSYGGVD